MTTNDMYIRLNHEQYKNVEDQLRRFDELETTHRTVEGGYHKAFRLHITETFVLELQGPLIKPPLEMTDETAAGCFHKWYSTDYDMAEDMHTYRCDMCKLTVRRAAGLGPPSPNYTV